MRRATAALLAALVAARVAAAEPAPVATPTGEPTVAEVPVTEASTPAVPVEAPAPRWHLRLPAPGPVEFHGVVSFDGAGTGSAGILYPAPNAAGLIAAIFTHGAVVSGMKSGQKTRLQKQADEVLAPHRAAIDALQVGAVLRDALGRLDDATIVTLAADARPPAEGWVVESLPVVQMTQDRRALVLDNAVVVRDARTPKQVAYQNVVRVVASPRADEDLVAAWNDADGAALREAVVAMYARSLALALADVGIDPAASPVPFKTMRYLEGETERIERARPLEVDCGRALLRNLRGWLMSVPLRPDPTKAVACAAAPTPAPATDAAPVVAPAAAASAG